MSSQSSTNRSKIAAQSSRSQPKLRFIYGAGSFLLEEDGGVVCSTSGTTVTNELT